VSIHVTCGHEIEKINKDGNVIIFHIPQNYGALNIHIDVIKFHDSILNDAFTTVVGSHGSSVSIVSGYGLDDWGSIPDRGRGFFF
jgi:hypothetical protein